MAFHNNPRIVTNGIVGNWDPEVSQFPPRGIATTWVYYGSAAHSNPLGTDGVYLKTSSTGWVGYFPATVPSTGEYTVMFDYVTDVANTNGLVLDNDGISDNLYNATLDTTSVVQHFQKTINVTVAGAIKFYCRRNAGGNITITNFRYFKTGPLLYDCAGGSDGSGSGNNGFMHNGTCFDFDGTDDLVLTNDPVITGTGDFTFTAWINISSFASTNFICGNYGTGNTGGVEFYTIAAGPNKLRVHIVTGGINSDTSMVVDTWYHVGVTRLGGEAQLYINGVADGASGTFAGSIVGNNNFSIGNGADYTSENMDGIIADVKAFDIALSVAQIKELYDDSKVIIPSNISQTNLMGWWPLAEGAGDICYDGSGNGYHGIVSNEDGDEWLTGQTGCPQLVEGYNSPMLFPGATSDYVAVGNTSEFCFGTSDFSFGAWIKTSNTATFNMVFDALRPVNKGWQFGVYGTSPYMRLWASTGWSQVNVDASTNVCDGQWHHVGFTSYAGSPQLVTLYVDGSADASSGSMGALNMVGGAYASWIGGQADGPNYPFDGLINEVVLYDALLSSSEMAALAATGPNGGPLPPDPMSGASNLSAASNVKGYWRNDGDVTWTDRSGEGNNGTVAGSPDALLFKQGYNGQKNVNTGRDNQGFPLLFEDVGAIGFTSPTSPWMSSSYVDLGSDSVLDLATGTIDMWFRLANPMSGGSNSASGYLLDGGPSYFYFSSSSSQLYYFLSGASANVSSLSGTWDTNWHNVIVKSDGITAYMYIDGVQQTTADASGEDLFVFDASVKIGHSSASIVGQVAGLRLYNRALTYSEIQQNFNAQRSRFNV